MALFLSLIDPSLLAERVHDDLVETVFPLFDVCVGWKQLGKVLLAGMDGENGTFIFLQKCGIAMVRKNRAGELFQVESLFCGTD
jgi:hypothetical protein